MNPSREDTLVCPGLGEAATLHGHEGPASGLAFSPDGNYLVSAGGGAVRLWKAPTLEEISVAERMIEAKK